MMNNDNYATWLEIDLNAITANYNRLKEISGVPVMGVVKANAYGHGLEETALHLQHIGAQWLGVARIEEALQLRESGIQTAILVLGYTSPKRVKDAQKANIHLTIYDPLVAHMYEEEVDSELGRLNLHAKIDTGMGRLGVPAEHAPAFIEDLSRVRMFNLEGVFTHFACADEPEKPVTLEQISKFEAVLSKLKEKGIDPGLVHAANSAGTLNFPQAHYHMVRCGIATYGLTPAASMTLPEGFVPSLAWKTRLISIKSMPQGHGISYGHRYHTREGERIGAIAVGYGDGMRRVMGNHVLLRGKKVPMVGSVCMDQCMLNLDAVPDAQVGDEVVLIGSQNGSSLSATDLAEEWNTINYEVICGMAARMPRRYIRSH
jgi:alanine racemase